MRTTLLPSALLWALLLFTGTTADAETVDVTVPFDFTVQHRLMPAGKYSVERDLEHPSTLVIRERSGAHETVVVSAMNAPGHNPSGHGSALVFTRRGDGYQLKDVWHNASDGEELVLAR
jgi:hypothetical protein